MTMTLDNAITIAPVEVTADVTPIQQQAEALVVRDSLGAEEAAALLQDVKSLRAEIESAFDPSITLAHQTHKTLLAEKKKRLLPVDSAELVIKRKIAGYHDEQRKLAQEAERKARADAQREAEERRLAEALKAESEGNSAKAEALIAAPVRSVAPVVSAPALPKGVSTRENWKFRIVDADAIPREYLIADEVKIGQIVRAMKGATAIPGIEAYPETVVSAKGF